MSRSSRPSRRPSPAAPAPAEAPPFTLSPRALLALTAGLAIVYFALSRVSDGFYQHDEVAHFVGMRQFWHDPSSALGNWAKPGYKVLYALPALLGPTFVAFFNAVVAAACAWAGVGLARRLGVQTPLFAFVLLAFQPLWMGLSFRNYSELPTALLLLLAVWAHYARRPGAAALLLSYAATIRQEFYPLVLLYGGFLLYRRQWIAALALVLFPLLNHAWGWAATGNPRYLLDEMAGTSQTIQDAYARQGFWHYFKTAHVIFGGLALAAFVVYGAGVVREKKPAYWFALVPLALYVAAHVAFQIQSVRIGPSTGGNLRYLTVVAPLVAVLGAVGIDRLGEMRRSTVGVALGGLALLTAMFLTYRDNNIVLLPERSFWPLLSVVLAGAALVVPLARRTRLFVVAGLAVVLAAIQFRPYPRTPEDALMADVAAWAQAENVGAHPLLVAHPLFYYFQGRAPGDYPRGAAPPYGPSLDTARAGTFVVWDSHYAYRPNVRPDDVSYETLLADSARFRLVRPPFVSSDGRFGVFVFEKTAR